MWTYLRAEQVEPWRGHWHARMVLSDDGEESASLEQFRSEPTPAMLDERGAAIAAVRNAMSGDAELREAIRDNTVKLKYQSKAELGQRFRGWFRDATRTELMQMAYWIIERLNAGDFTDTQVRNLFGLTNTQYNNLKTKMTAMHDQWAAILEARGE